MNEKTAIQTQLVYIEGMHCSACQELVRQQIMRLPGVVEVIVDMGKKTALVSLKHDTKLPDINQYLNVLRDYDYIPCFEKPIPPAFSLQQWAPSFAIAAAVIAVFFLIQRAGIINFGTSTDAAQGTPAFALLMGFAASLSSCLAVTGSLVLAFSVLYAPENEKARFLPVLKPNLLFHSGRIGFFALGGAALGIIGGTLTISGQVMGIFQIIVALAMFVLAISMLGLSLIPSFGQKGIFKKLNILTERLKTSRHPVAPVILGAITFFLPCGFTQTMQVYALASGSPMRGAMVLALFALGTLPVLLIAGLTASWTSKKSMIPVRRAAGLLIVVFSVYTFFSALNLIGFAGNIIPEISSQDKTIIADTPKKTGVTLTDTGITNSATDESETIKTQINEKTSGGIDPAPSTNTAESASTIEMHVKYEGFTPAVLKVKKGQKITWNVYGDEVTGCTSAIIVPKLGLKFKVNKGLNTVTFTADQTGTLNYTCWMGMVWGKIIVEE